MAIAATVNFCINPCGSIYVQTLELKIVKKVVRRWWDSNLHGTQALYPFSYPASYKERVKIGLFELQKTLIFELRIFFQNFSKNFFVCELLTRRLYGHTILWGRMFTRAGCQKMPTFFLLVNRFSKFFFFLECWRQGESTGAPFLGLRVRAQDTQKCYWLVYWHM